MSSVLASLVAAVRSLFQVEVPERVLTFVILSDEVGA